MELLNVYLYVEPTKRERQRRIRSCLVPVSARAVAEGGEDQVARGGEESDQDARLSAIPPMAALSCRDCLPARGSTTRAPTDDRAAMRSVRERVGSSIRRRTVGRNQQASFL